MSRFVSHYIAGTGEDRSKGASFWYAFLTSFWGGSKTGFVQEREGIPGTRASCFSWLLYLWLSWTFFLGAILVAILWCAIHYFMLHVPGLPI